MKIFGLAGWSGSGKTTLLVRLLPTLTERGLRVSTMKHAHHDFDVDLPGKDSYEHRVAGATEVLVTSATRWALMHELRQTPEPTLESLVNHMTPVDLLLVEGFKHHGHDKLLIHRGDARRPPPLDPADSTVVAIASDGSLAHPSKPVFDLADIAGIARFIIGHCRLRER